MSLFSLNIGAAAVVVTVGEFAANGFIVLRGIVKDVSGLVALTSSLEEIPNSAGQLIVVGEET